MTTCAIILQGASDKRTSRSARSFAHFSTSLQFPSHLIHSQFSTPDLMTLLHDRTPSEPPRPPRFSKINFNIIYCRNFHSGSFYLRCVGKQVTLTPSGGSSGGRGDEGVFGRKITHFPASYVDRTCTVGFAGNFPIRSTLFLLRPDGSIGGKSDPKYTLERSDGRDTYTVVSRGKFPIR